jgi:hypothetical protein
MTIIKSESPQFRKCIKPVVVLGLCLSLLQACTKEEAVKHEEEAEAEVEHHVSLPTKCKNT